ncbi:DUF4238 domain-containing protein [Paenibacillus sp. F411]|uniref:DUF4238 domain-containing protein n=1 Tax=Paenibacillus sp. F411 TaxID=2820239 RepID=UPI001AAF3AA0|nr:DUF4238 domain-containing protein [Paenibacillus sp. F411]MBO2942791.1 DUF4238 domain-containing protein [Paenibacillus sp. F411]
MTKVKHHFIPAFHLAMFTQGGTKESILWVFDQTNGKQRDAVPKSVGYQKHLYSVDLPNIEPDVIEDVFKVIEDKVAPIIKEICNTKQIPASVEDYNWLINYIALLAERTPVRLEHVTKPIKEISKLISQMTLATPEKFEALKKKIGRDGVEFDENVSYKELKEFIFGDNYTISVDNNTRIRGLFNAIDAIIPFLGARNWTVVYSPPEIGDFVCSDNPVSLHWIVKENRGVWSSPGHGLKETEVSVPLSSRVMLLGRFEEVPPIIVISSKIDLANLNSYTGLHSDRFVFSRENDFIWYRQDNAIGNVADFQRLIFEREHQIDESVDNDE